MNAEQVRLVIDKLVDQAHVPTVSFTGGEPTTRTELPDFIAYAKQRGMRVNLITNGLRCGRAAYAEQLAAAGLDSAQVSIEAGDAATHDSVVQQGGAFERTLAAVRNLKAAGVHTHTNTTINTQNVAALPGLIDLLADMGQEYLSMNMVIRTGDAVGKHEVDYRTIGEIVLRLKEQAEARGMRFVWYSPVPYCLFNPIVHGLGGQSCSAADGLLSIAPDGQVLPCSSFEQGIGNLLHDDFASIWNSTQARYWREKQFLPPGCRGCELAHICMGACPLYWDEKGSFADIRDHLRPTWPGAQLIWKARRALVGRVRGVNVG
jgi:radical SAM protein with 4Fe4S-binding SPASM domain